jgi:hypothetical protein
MATCKTLKCENEAVGKSGYCSNCQSGFYYWASKRPAQVLERRRKLTIYRARVETIIDRRNIHEKE